ncbi:relaxase/mobilization nuclease domain-containing protein [Streptosporangium amethystogenes]|uniref:relaxase/mobilization nuclease domain-containing protein n=1 Tax=Streptosporangium amethystogenes TaxID=2002 RepID=UPI000690D382|nr:relaxase/mobilization nuclease domain-containing protein [Streptosporangium amethystogenes]
MNNFISAQRGSSPAGLVRYLFGPGSSGEHTDQRIIAADVTLGLAEGTRLDHVADADAIYALGRDMDSHRILLGVTPPNGWVWHCAISLPPGEELADAQWAEVARTAVARMGFDEADDRAPCRWIAVHHGRSVGGNEHIHLMVNLVREDGKVAATWNDRRTMSRVCAEMERRFDLVVVEGRAGHGMPGYSKAEHQKMRAGAPSERQRLARLVRAAAARSASEAEFVRRVKASGALVRPRFVTGGRDQVVGYSAALRPAEGQEPVWFGGGKLAADLTLPRLRQQWDIVNEHQALAEWRRSPDVAGPPGPGEQTAVDVTEWARAAQLVDAVRERLQHTPPGDVVVWRSGCRGAAAMVAALAERIETPSAGGPGPIAALADRLAWSAQAPRGEGRGRPAGWGEVRAVVRIIGHAARKGPASATWMVVAAALLVLVATIAAWHEQHRQLRQAAALTEHTKTLAHDLHRRRAAAAPAWTERRYGALTDARLEQLATVAAADVARFSSPPPAAPPRPARPVDQEAHGAATAAALAFPGRRRPATVEEARGQLAAISKEIGLRAAMSPERVAQERTERAQAQQTQRAQVQRTVRSTPQRGPSQGQGSRGR